MTIGEIAKYLNRLAPEASAENWDRVGLLVGDADQKAEKVAVGVDLTVESIQRAKKWGANLIVTHHPCIFGEGLKSLTAQRHPAVFEAIGSGISVIACHTNFDRCALEVVEQVSTGLGIRAEGRLHDPRSEKLVKLAVFVPDTHAEPVQEALFAAGAGHIGRYDKCSFRIEGVGSFRGLEGTHPFVGRQGVLEKAAELRIETLVPQGLVGAVLAAVKSVHPYEEMAYDLFPVEQRAMPLGIARGVGYGFWGDLSARLSFSDLISGVKNLFKLSDHWTPAWHSDSADRIKYLLDKKVSRVAFVPGKGSSFIESAIGSGVEVFVTGETGYHPSREARARGMEVLEIGHPESECFFVDVMKKWLSTFGLEVSIF